jgi:type I restriction enzyme S subunit
VNFRFPNYENTPFNEETGLPEGWVILALKDIYNKLESGSRPKGGIDKDLKDGIPSIGAESIKELGYFDFSKTKFVSIDFFEKMNKGIIEDRDILIYKDGAYIGKTTLFQDDFPYTTCAVNEHVFLLNTKNKLQQYYLFFTLSSKEYYSKMQNLNSNAAQPGINQNKLLQLELSIPNKDKLLTDFNEKVEPLIRQIYSLAKINKKLKEARDILLPRLMNRTIEV